MLQSSKLNWLTWEQSHAAPKSFDAARIESGTPLFGRDITDENLPQEIDRDRLAISFTKGCYLGQETVARIDALGHVNRLLRAVKFPPQSPTPPVGTELQTPPQSKAKPPQKPSAASLLYAIRQS